MSEQTEIATEETAAPEPVDSVAQDTATEKHVDPVAADTTSETSEEGRPNPRKVREGLVVSTKMEKTAVVAVIERVRHPRYVKTVQRTKRLYAHDPDSAARVGDRVRLAETRPLSKLKRWRIVEVLERAK